LTLIEELAKLYPRGLASLSSKNEGKRFGRPPIAADLEKQLRAALNKPWGPTGTAIRQIDAELSRANDIDMVLTNDPLVQKFHRQIDALIQALERGSDHDASTPAVMQE
jgi:hypothetical protein